MAYRKRPQPPRDCNQCGNVYTPQDPRQRYCTPACRASAATAIRSAALENYVCAGCSGTFTRRRSTGAGATGRCRPCSKRGVLNERYAGGLTFNKALGRWYVNCRDGSTIAYYRAVVAADLGRLLTSDEHVHHINGDSTDDRPENLEVVSTQQHIEIHRPQMIAALRRRNQEAQAA